MRRMWPPSVAIFFMTYFHRAREAWPPRPPPPGSATVQFTLIFSNDV